MINSVNIGNISNFSAKIADNQTRKNSLPQKQNLSFGHEDEYKSHPIRDLFVTLTNDFVGLVGFNAALWWLQDFVNSKLLIGKINKHFTKNIQDKEQLENLAKKMVEKHHLKDVLRFENGAQGEAYFTNAGNKVVIGEGEYSALFHEIGHAVEENGTKVFKWLQNHRGNYTVLSLALYALLSQTQKPQTYYEDEDQGIGGKVKNFLRKSNAVIPLLAFSPELITEGKATSTGLKFLRKEIGKDSLLYKNIRKSYLTCFATYLFIPVSIMLMDSLQRSATKVRMKKQASRNGYY